MNKTWLLLLAFPITVAGQVNFQSSNLPIVVITTNNGEAIPDEPKITAQMRVIDNGPGQINHLSDSPNGYNGFIGIERRGSTSQDLSDKKPYAVETRAADGTDLDVPLLGMPAEADWVFMAPFNDKSLVRDALTFELARRIMPWAPRSRFVELVLNGEYQGVYLVAEKIKRGKDRVDISKLTEIDLSGDELTGGYILKIDKTAGANNDGWISPYLPLPGSWQTTYFQFHYPKPEDIQPEQAQYIEDWMTNFEDAMASPQYADPDLGYPKFIDVQSFVDFIIINEIAKNVDAYRLSTFLYKDKDSKNPQLFAGPVWDFNIALGNADYCDGYDYKGWAIDFNDECSQDFWVIHFWWNRLWDDPAFRVQLSTRWAALRNNLYTDAKVTGILDSLVGSLQQAQVRNWQRWPVLHEWVWPNVFCCGTYAQHTAYLRAWLLDRLHWMDGAMATLEAPESGSEDFLQTEVFPNPSHNALVFKYQAHYADEISIRVFDAMGRAITTLNAAPQADGENFHAWPHALPTGVYGYMILKNDRPESSGKFVVDW